MLNSQQYSIYDRTYNIKVNLYQIKRMKYIDEMFKLLVDNNFNESSIRSFVGNLYNLLLDDEVKALI